MLKLSMTVAALGSLTLVSVATVATPASAQSHVVPMGDTVQVTPPVDLTPGQIRRARPRDRAVLEGRSAYRGGPRVNHHVTGPYVGR